MTAAAAAVLTNTPVGRKAHRTVKQPSEPSQSASRTDAEKATVRVQFDVSSRSMDRLKKLKDKIEAHSYAEVVKNSLRLYEALIAAAEDGSQFLVRDKEGKLSAFSMFA